MGPVHAASRELDDHALSTAGLYDPASQESFDLDRERLLLRSLIDSLPDLVFAKDTEGVYIAVAAGMVGFAFIWHVWWILVVSFIAVVALIIRRTLNDDTEYTLTADELYRLDKEARA